jgi:hypothetical protein
LCACSSSSGFKCRPRREAGSESCKGGLK